METWSLLKARSNGLGKPRFFHGVYRFSVSKVRHCGERPRAVAVFDTAEPKRAHHAELMILATPGLNSERIVKALVEAVGTNFTGPLEFRDGLLKDAAKPA